MTVAKVSGASVRLYEAVTGTYKTTITPGGGLVKNAEVEGDLVSITSADNHVRIYKTNGTYVRTI